MAAHSIKALTNEFRTLPTPVNPIFLATTFTYGGHQDPGDGGLDVIVECSDPPINGFGIIDTNILGELQNAKLLITSNLLSTTNLAAMLNLEFQRRMDNGKPPFKLSFQCRFYLFRISIVDDHHMSL